MTPRNAGTSETKRTADAFPDMFGAGHDTRRYAV